MKLLRKQRTLSQVIVCITGLVILHLADLPLRVRNKDRSIDRNTIREPNHNSMRTNEQERNPLTIDSLYVETNPKSWNDRA